jgi:hypothetical protein
LLRGLAGAALAGLTHRARGQDRGGFQICAFNADVTPPIGHACMGGGIAPVARIEDPLSARGIVLLGAEKPIVLCSVDWCEIRNDAHERWREALAQAVGTTRERVLVSSVHQHDTPIADLEAQRLLERRKSPGSICDLAFHERAVQGVARAVRESLARPRGVTHVGAGQALVEKVASNRRFVRPDGTVSFARTSSTRDPAAHDAAEGTIDPWLKALSFWDGDRPVAVLSFYATHPMSHYGQGGTTSDFVGLARNRRQEEDPAVLQVYFSGASGNVTAGKHNDGAPENRKRLADRMHAAMSAAFRATERWPLGRAALRVTPLRLEPRSNAGFTVADLEKRLAEDPKPFGQCLAALGLSWRKRADAGVTIDVPAIDFGPARLVLLPGESYVEHQLHAQRLLPESFVCVAGYGECAPGYVPTEKAVVEGDTNLGDWCWVAPGAERAVREALARALA